MDANTIDLTKLFTQSVQYVVPIFQRPYVWNEDDHWDPLWQDIEAVMADRAAGFEHPHFLGAVVLDQMPTSTANVDRRQIIDGQQRLTTLQLLLAAARDEAAGRQLDRLRGQLALMVENNEYVVESDQDIPKVLPTRSDQAAFMAAMNGNDHDRPSQVVDAYRFFRTTISDWLDDDEDAPFDERFQELVTTLTKLLRVVVIDLDDKDDAQVIFETLNARGTPLEAADLIKNYLFDRARRAGQDVEALHDDVWSVFLDDYWREDVRQGRLMRSRIDVFINHYLSMQTGREVMSSKLFAAFKQWFEHRAESPGAVMEDLERYGTVFSRFDSFPSDTRESVFFRRLGILDVTTVHPFLLWLFGLDESRLQVEDRHRILDWLESFLVGRMLCRMTTKGYNRHFLSLLLSVRETDDIAEGVRTFLLASDADTFRWPNGRELTDRLIESALYGNVRRDRLQLVFAAVSEDAMSDRLEEPIRIAGDLTIEHLMPRRWETHWPLAGGLEERERRDALINTIGNLTIITQGLNSKISNGPWVDKRQAILQHSALPINRQLPERWDEDAILDRSKVIAEAVSDIWPWPGAPPPDPSVSTSSDISGTTEPDVPAQGRPSVVETAVESDEDLSPRPDSDDGTCEHHIPAVVCAVCEADTEIVWTTASGSAFHVISDCESLEAGQKGAADAGYETYEIREISRAEAVSSGRKLCGVCADLKGTLEATPRSTARQEILSAMDRLQQETGHAACQLSDIVSEVLKHTTRYPETTLRTHIASFMCVDAPHHNPSWPDLRRIDRGVYKRIDRDGSEPSNAPSEETPQITAPSAGLPTPLHRLLTRLAGGPPIHSLERGNPNWVIEFDAENVMVETERSRKEGADPQPIPIAWLTESYWSLWSEGSLARTDLSKEASHRSAFILAALAELPGIEVHTRPIRLILGEGTEVSDDKV